MASLRLRLDKFCFRQWDDAHYSGTRMPHSISKEVFLQHVLKSGPFELRDGYAPFCKHLFLRNTFVPGLKASTVRLDAKTASLVESQYQARTEKELPVLVRWIPAARAQHLLEEATWLDIILYSKDQIVKECRATKEEDDTSDIDYDWGIISVKAQTVNFELPMTPITMMRNALGKEEGGSGVQLDREKYLESVRFWSENVVVV
jgi:hypothetical protein